MVKLYFLLIASLFAFTSCKDNASTHTKTSVKAVNTVAYAKGLEIYKYSKYTVVRVNQPWPGAKKNFTYVMQQNGAVVPDSLRKYALINVPLKSIVVTSTTHIPSLEALGVENTLKGFPGINYVSSVKTRALIDSGKVREAGVNESLNTEVLLNMAPDAIVAFGIDGSNKTLDALQKSGLNVIYNGDWTEQSPLGKAEWIKFFGALYAQDTKAEKLFGTIEKEYTSALKLAQKVSNKPTLMAGAIYQDQWLLPQGRSWAALFFKDAGSQYLWEDTAGTGSLSLSFETVLEKAERADFWIGPSQFTSFKEMSTANPHYTQFKSFKNKQVYSFSTKKGATGGVLYYELAPNRPDLVLKDLISIIHPELLPNYQLQFFEKLH